MSDNNSDSSPEIQDKWGGEMTSVFAELNRLREALTEKDKEITKLQRETHKLKSVIEKSELRRIPSLSSSQAPGGNSGTSGHQKKCGVSGESCGWNVSSSTEDEPPEATSTSSTGQQIQIEPQRHHKDFRTRQLIRAALGDNDFLQNLDREQIRDMVDFMFPQTFAPGEFVIREGVEVGSHLYVSAEGSLYVSQGSRNLGILKPGVAFGELALLYNCKRTASVRAITECKVWALGRRAFRMAMMKAGMQRIKDRLAFLKSVPLLKGLDAASLGRIADCLEVEHYPQGSFIIREGSAGDTFFIISEGRVQVTTTIQGAAVNPNPSSKNSWSSEIAVPLSVPEVQIEFDNFESSPTPSNSSTSNTRLDNQANPSTQILRQLGHGDYFGEHALLREERRSANVIAITEVEVLTLDRESFLQLIGDLSEFNLHRKPLQSSSCTELNTLDGDPDWGSGSTLGGSPKCQDRYDEVFNNNTSNRKQLSCSLPNPTLEKCYLKADEFDYSKLRLNDLEFVATLGVGGFGRVELVQISYDPNRVFALKCLPKAQISATQQQEHVFSERNIMMTCNSPFIARTFKDSKYVYMLMEACLGGEVWTVLRDKGSFDEGTTRFIAACVVLALDYLHDRSIIYRDLKPENLMLANDGYVKLVDFGFSKVVPATSKTWTFCGTPEYCAPEVILNKGHDHTVDFWAFGILLFELLTGCPPWGPMAENGSGSETSDPLATYNAILKGIDSVHFTKTVGKGAISLIRRLCRQVPGERLGSRNFRDITCHRWWQGFDWDGVRQRRMKPPIRCNLRGTSDISNFDKFELEIENVADDFSGWDDEF